MDVFIMYLGDINVDDKVSSEYILKVFFIIIWLREMNLF